MAAQLTRHQRLVFARARLVDRTRNSSLPVPVSPKIRTVASVTATRFSDSNSSFIAGLAPSISPMPAMFAHVLAQVFGLVR